jgi:hypothetical protein
MSGYDDLLKEARAKCAAFQSTAREYIPKMYSALCNENSKISSADARDRIEKDCVGIWSKRTILDALPDEAKNPEKQKAGRLGQTKRNSAAFSAARKEILIDNQGIPIREEPQGPPQVDDSSIADSRNSLKNEFDLKECSGCKEQYEKNQELEDALRKATVLSTADTIDTTASTESESSDILDFDVSLPYRELQEHMTLLFQRGKNEVRLIIKINIATKKVISAKVLDIAQLDSD